jgi:hypothetical protein
MLPEKDPACLRASGVLLCRATRSPAWWRNTWIATRQRQTLPNAHRLNPIGTAPSKCLVELTLPAVGNRAIKANAIAFPIPCVTMDVRRMTM